MSNTLTVLLVTYNSKEFITPCLNGLFSQDKPFNLIVIDNNSNDGTLAILHQLRKKKYFCLVCLKENAGFGKAINLVEPFLKTRFLFIANPDTLIKDRSFLSRAMQLMNEKKELTGVAPLLLHPLRGTIDSMGITYNPFTLRPADLGAGKDMSFVKKERKVLGCTGAMAFYRLSHLREVKKEDGYLFDEKIFLYYEDADLAFRLSQKGFVCIGSPNLVAYHYRRQSYRQDKIIEAQAYFNRLYTLRKNLTWGLFMKGFPVNIIWEICRFFKILSHNFLLLKPFLGKKLDHTTMACTRQRK